MARPSGSAPSHDLHRSPAFGMIEPVPGCEMPPDKRPMLATAGGVFGVAMTAGAVCRSDARGCGGAAGSAGGGAMGADGRGAAGAFDEGGAVAAAAAVAPVAPGRLAGIDSRAVCSAVDERNGTAMSGVPGSKAGPASRVRNAPGESETRTVANCLNEDGSGLVAASVALSTSRMWSSTMR